LAPWVRADQLSRGCEVALARSVVHERNALGGLLLDEADSRFAPSHVRVETGVDVVGRCEFLS
jgi:hypothetical protein